MTSSVEGAPRVVCQFSCGAASAVATKLTLAQNPNAIVLNAYLKNEHPDNRRFAADCEIWFGKSMTVLRDEKYGADIINVFRQRGFIKGPRGASCTTALKRGLLRTFEHPGDILVLGFTAEEQDRLDDWRENWPDRTILCPLIDRGLTKEDCKAMVERAGIALPFMYLQGYENANCIGCVKGGEGYFRAIREDYPEEFEALAQIEGGNRTKRIHPALQVRAPQGSAIPAARPASRSGGAQRNAAVVQFLLRACRTGVRAMTPTAAPVIPVGEATEIEPEDAE